jgi:hypothetical protein
VAKNRLIFTLSDHPRAPERQVKSHQACRLAKMRTAEFGEAQRRAANAVTKGAEAFAPNAQPIARELQTGGTKTTRAVGRRPRGYQD